MHHALLLLNNSKKEYNINHNKNLFVQKINMFKNKKNKISNQLIHNYSSSFLKFKKIKPKLFSLNRFLDYKRNNSINSLSSNYGKNNNIFKNFENFSFNIKNKTLKKKHKIIFLNGNDFKRKLKKELSFYKKINFKQLLTSNHDNKCNNSFEKSNIFFTKYKTKVKLKNNLILNARHSFNCINLKNNGNIRNSENLYNCLSFYQKMNKKNNIITKRFHASKSSKKNKIKLNEVINKIKKYQNIVNNSYEKLMENNNQAKIKKQSIFLQKIKNSKRLKSNFKRYVGRLTKRDISKKMKKFFMKTNQGFTSRKNSSFSHENIFLNNNYNNFINFNYIDKNFNINSINISNKTSIIKPIRKNSQKIIYKKVNQDFLSYRKNNNELIDFLQLKLKGNNNISTLQSREDISISDIKKINSFLNLIPNNSSFNLISPDNKIKNIFEYKNNPHKTNFDIKALNKKDTKNNNVNEPKKIKEKEIIINNKKRESQKNKDLSQNKNIINESKESISNIFNLSHITHISNNISISTTKDKSYYINERENLSIYIKRYFKEKGQYPKSHINFYKYGRILGKGAFGKVNLALHIASGKLVAIKSFNKSKLLTEHSKNKINTEIEVLKRVRNNIFCTKIYDTFQTDTHILIVMEFVCEDLLNFIRKREKLSEKISKMIIKQIIIGLKQIHKLNIIHRDIKLDNLLLDFSNTIKICDFGVSKILNSSDDVMHDHCGTPAYIAPEVFGSIGYCGFGCDIWSLGVTLYYMLGGEQPFKGKNLEEMKTNISTKNYQKIENISKEANDLLDKIFTVNPDERITLDGILKHSWLKDVDIKERSKIKFFSKSKKYLLGKYNICYLNNNTEDLIEDFDKENINTEEIEEKKGNTKSLILAPYNTCISFFDDFSESNEENKDLKIEMNICKFKGEAQLSNIKYEMSNNDEFDNGVIKTNPGYSLSSFSSFSQNLKNDILDEDKNEKKKETNNNSNFEGKNKNNFYKNFRQDIIKEIEEKIGYNRDYLIQCLKNDEINYATATYYLMLKDKNEKNYCK